MSVDSDIKSGSQSPQKPITAEANHRRSQSPQKPIVSVEKMEDKVIDEADCIEVHEGKMVKLNDNQRAAQFTCFTVVGSKKVRMKVRVQTENNAKSIDVPLGTNLGVELLEELSKMMMVRKQPFPSGDDDECKDEQCLEVQADIDLDAGLSVYLAFYIGDIRGGDRVYTKLVDSRLKLYGVTVTTAIEDAGIDKMKELGLKEVHLLLRDIPKSEPFISPTSWDRLSTNISQWLVEKFGGSSQVFEMTGKVVSCTLCDEADWPTVNSGEPCTFRGDAPIPIECLVDYPWGVKVDQVICITKVDDDEVADPVSQESKADSVAIDDLLDFESASFVSQIGHGVVQNPWISHSVAFGIGCIVPIILKAIIKKMAPRRVRRRIMMPLIDVSVQNEEDENMR